MPAGAEDSVDVFADPLVVLDATLADSLAFFTFAVVAAEATVGLSALFAFAVVAAEATVGLSAFFTLVAAGLATLVAVALGAALVAARGAGLVPADSARVPERTLPLVRRRRAASPDLALFGRAVGTFEVAELAGFTDVSPGDFDSSPEAEALDWALTDHS